MAPSLEGLARTDPAAKSRWYDSHRTEATSPWTYSATDQWASDQEPLWASSVGGITFSVVHSGESVWVLAQFPAGARVALRGAYCPRGQVGPAEARSTRSGVRLGMDSPIGAFRMDIDFPDDHSPLLHVATTLRPNQPLTIPYWPRDLIALGTEEAVADSAGRIYAQQDGPRTGLVHFSITRPGAGSVLYFQNLTALNDYAEQTHTSLADVVGGTWPELGLALPGSATRSLQADHDTVLSDAYVALCPVVPDDDLAMAEQFLELLAQIMVALPRHHTDYVHWPDIAEKSLHDLSNAPQCTIKKDGHFFLNAYVSDNDQGPTGEGSITLNRATELGVGVPAAPAAGPKRWRRPDAISRGDPRADRPRSAPRPVLPGHGRRRRAGPASPAGTGLNTPTATSFAARLNHVGGTGRSRRSYTD